MNHYEPTNDESTDLEPRDVRALTEAMTVLPEGGDIFTVVGQNGNGEYRVDTREGRCTCPDHEYRGVTCKHIRRARFATGERPVPGWVDTDNVDPLLGEHTDAPARVAATDGGMIEAGDDGEIIDNGEDGDGRPDDCDCGDWNQGTGIPCWPCYRDGFEVPAGE